MSLESRRVTSSLIVLGFILFFIYFIIQNLSWEDGNTSNSGVFKQFYANQTSSKQHFIIVKRTWKFVLAYQWLFSIYSMITLCRREAIHILPSHFYMAWIFSSCFEIGQLLLSSKRSIHWAWCCACSAAICRFGCLFFAFAAFFEYLAAHTRKHKRPNKFDIWCQRALVQNGLLCFQAWSSTSICMEFATNLTLMFDLSQLNASYCSMMLLGVITFIWFMLQNFHLEKYTRYTFAEYITLIVMLSQIFAMNRKEIGGSYAISLLFLCFFVILLTFRVSFVIYNEGERKYASDEELEFMR